MAKFTLAAGLDEKVAAMIRKDVGEVAKEAGRVAQRLAPPTKTWISMRDAKVREPHVEADGTEIPDNLRFRLTAFRWDLEHPGALPIAIGGGGGTSDSGWSGSDETVPGRYSWLVKPRDKSMGHYVQIVNCRCQLQMDPRGIAKMIRVTEPTVFGTKVSASVIAQGPHVIEAEYGDVYEGDMYADGTKFMHRTVKEMGARARL